MCTDTVSLLLEIKTNDVDKGIDSDKNLSDTSDYPKEHPLYSNLNKKVLGKMKDAERVYLRPKIYSILKADEKTIKKAKGVKKTPCQETNNAVQQYRETLLVRGSYGMELTFSEVRGMRSTECTSTKFRFESDDSR